MTNWASSENNGEIWAYLGTEKVETIAEFWLNYMFKKRRKIPWRAIQSI